MKMVKLTEEQVKVLHDALNMGDPQRGLTISDIRAAMPLIDKLEKPAKKEKAFNRQVGAVVETLYFVPLTLELKQSEYEFCLSKLEASSGWMSVEVGRKVVQLIDYIKEIPSVEDTAEEKKA
jgi:hypothetical protein